MYQVVQPMQTVTVDGQEALFIPNMNANQLNGAQPIQIGNQQAFLTPSGQIIRAPTNIIQNMGQTVSLPTGKRSHLILHSHSSTHPGSERFRSIHFTVIAFGQATLTIPGANISIPITANSLSNLTAHNSASQQSNQTAAQQTQAQQSQAANQAGASATSQQAHTAQQQASQQQAQQTVFCAIFAT